MYVEGASKYFVSNGHVSDALSRYFGLGLIGTDTALTRLPFYGVLAFPRIPLGNFSLEMWPPHLCL